MSQTTKQLQQKVRQATTPQQTVTALLDLASHLAKSDLQKSITVLEKAQQLIDKGDVQVKEQIRTLIELGSLHIDLRDNEMGIHYLEQAVALADDHQENVLKARALENIGFAYLEFGNFTEAMAYYLECLNISRQEKDVRTEINALNGIGLVYSEAGNSEEALTHLNQALSLERQHKGKGEGFILNNCALEYAKLGNFERTLEYGLRSLELAHQQDDQFGEVFARNRVGEGYMGLGDFEQANSYFQKNLQLLQDPGLQPRRLYTLCNLGKLRIKQQAYSDAADYLEEALKIAQKAEGKQFIYEIHERLAEAHKRLGNFEAALAHYEQFHAVKEAVFNEKSQNTQRGLEIAYKIEATKRETTLLQQKNAELEREITERKRAEEEALTASQAKSQFLATMSHELRTPLNSIIGFADLVILELSHQKNFAIAEEVRRIHKNGLHLLELVNDVLDMARIETGKLMLYPEKVSPWLIVQEVIDFIPKFAKEGVEFKATADPDLPEFVVDVTRIKQVLLNLLSNAFKFTEEGWVTLTAAATPTTINFIVTDDGIGIPTSQLPNLFETFSQVDIPQNRTLRGTGLGLSISRDLAKLHGGTISVESEVGKGSTFTLHLPRQGNLEPQATFSNESPKVATLDE